MTDKTVSLPMNVLFTPTDLLLVLGYCKRDHDAQELVQHHGKPNVMSVICENNFVKKNTNFCLFLE